MLFLAPSQIHGIGVFSGEVIEPGLFHSAHIMTLDDEELSVVRRTKFGRLLYGYGENQAGLALTPMTLANHSSTPNATFEIDEMSKTITFTALARIEADEEITIDYKSLAILLGLEQPTLVVRSYQP